MFEDKNKITLATVKSFIRKNPNMYIKVGSKFDGMTDCVQAVEDSFNPIEPTDTLHDRTLGIAGAWFVGSSRDSISSYRDNHFDGVRVYNCCGEFYLVVKVG
jgi:hypothetical protein